MRRIEIAEGERFGALVVLKESANDGKRRFLCRCDCGRVSEVRLDHLRSGHSNSCGRCWLEWGGDRRTLREWAEERGIKESTLRARLKVMKLGEALERG